MYWPLQVPTLCFFPHKSAEVASLKKSVEALSAEMAKLRVLVLAAGNKTSQLKKAPPTPESQSTNPIP